MRELVREGAGIVWIAGSEDPQVLADVPPARAVRRVVDRPGLPAYRRAVGRADARFAVVAWPSPAWAAQVYPELTPEAAVEALGDDLLRFARLGADDPPDGWRRHAEALDRARGAPDRARPARDPAARAGHGPPSGAARRGELARGSQRRARPAASRRTSPPRRCSRARRRRRPPGRSAARARSRIAGRVITGIAGEFRRGRLVRIEADDEDDREFLAAFLARDRGAGRLGELALVDSSSRVGQAGRPYFTTLLDENAAAHIAFGLGFGDTRGPGGPAVNRSGVHLDVMIGAPDMDVEAVDGRGRPVTIIAGGLFAGDL